MAIPEELVAEAAEQAPTEPQRRPWRTPQFLQDRPLTGREKGSATHLFMQFVRYEACTDEPGVRAELQRLQVQKFLTPRQADRMLDAGADVITLGNHSFDRREICTYLDDCPYILRPGNLRPSLPGRGWGVFETKIGPVGVMNLLGRCNLDFRPDNPFLIADKILQELGEVPVFLDFHAEATSEKLALAYQLDGKIAAQWGTHTHVQTADEQILPKGTGYLTDLGMTGAVRSVLGIEPQQSVETFLGGLAGRYRAPEGPCKLQGAVFSLDSDTGLCVGVERVDVR